MLLTFSIVYAGALVRISALAQHVGNLTSHGMQWVAGDRSQAVPDDGFPGHASRALRNNLESAAMWVPIAVVAVARDETSTLLFWVPLVYIVVRTTFTLGYWLRINPMRSLSWLAGMICIAVSAVTVLRAGL
jgi:uncharacterized MAPEG superfamily protein